MIVTELLKTRLNAGREPAFYFWRDSNQREIDLLSEEGARLKAIEMKAGKTIARDFLQHLHHFQQLAGADTVDLFLIYGGDTAQARSDLQVLPWRAAAKVFE